MGRYPDLDFDTISIKHQWIDSSERRCHVLNGRHFDTARAKTARRTFKQNKNHFGILCTVGLLLMKIRQHNNALQSSRQLRVFTHSARHLEWITVAEHADLRPCDNIAVKLYQTRLSVMYVVRLQQKYSRCNKTSNFKTI